MLSASAAAEAVRGQLQLILLDFGLAEELTPSVRRHFISFLHMIAAGAHLSVLHRGCQGAGTSPGVYKWPPCCGTRIPNNLQ